MHPTASLIRPRHLRKDGGLGTARPTILSISRMARSRKIAHGTGCCNGFVTCNPHVGTKSLRHLWMRLNYSRRHQQLDVIHELCFKMLYNMTRLWI